MKVKKILSEFKKNAEQELRLFFENKKNEVKSSSPEIALFVDYIEEFTLRGGKRLRAALFYYTYKYFHPQKNRTIFRLAIFIELIQSFLLIHDDIMDHGDTRRGGKTFHKIYEAVAKKRKFKDPYHFGVSMGILAGDLTHLFAGEVIYESDFEAEDKINMAKMSTRLISETVYGQIKDIMLGEQEACTEAEIIDVHKLKTAKYTFVTPIITGATLAGAPRKTLNILNRYAINAGIAYQVRDDILGLFGDEAKTGKSSNSDIMEGKKTLLMYKALKDASKEDKQIMYKALGNTKLSKNDAVKVREIVRKTGALDYSIKLTQEYIDKAKNELNKLDKKDTVGWKFLYEVADYIIVREI